MNAFGSQQFTFITLDFDSWPFTGFKLFKPFNHFWFVSYSQLQQPDNWQYMEFVQHTTYQKDTRKSAANIWSDFFLKKKVHENEWVKQT